ncbi:MAG: hypothetical protein DHS20C19_18300 [Acidimicrobiales bacterium]|nr:MAG: hypothetical protein DHS20C19_18300 [Acidimicrobiales bacterium]
MRFASFNQESFVKVAVVYESRTGNTARAAEMVGAAAESLGHEVGVWETRKANLDFLKEADMVFVGTWTDGLIIGGHRPGDAGRLLDLPGIWGKPTAGFLTYAVHAGKVLDGLADVVELRGGDWIGGNVFKRHKLPEGIAGFVVAALDEAAARLGIAADA